MAVTCKNCGGPHPVWECRAAAKKSPTGGVAPHAGAVKGSTAALKEALANGSSDSGADARSLAQNGRVRPPLVQSSGKTTSSGTQAPTVETKRHIDRHKPGYMAAYMRKRRAKEKNK